MKLSLHDHAAIAAMAAFLHPDYPLDRPTPDSIAEAAVVFADALVKRLRSGNEVQPVVVRMGSPRVAQVDPEVGDQKADAIAAWQRSCDALGERLLVVRANAKGDPSRANREGPSIPYGVPHDDATAWERDNAWLFLVPGRPELMMEN
jgi:hypothetical protein